MPDHYFKKPYKKQKNLTIKGIEQHKQILQKSDNIEGKGSTTKILYSHFYLPYS